MNLRYAQSASAEADEGTAAHWVGWEILMNQPPKEGSPIPSGLVVTDEMLDGGALLVETIRKRVGSFESQGFIERRVMMPSIHEDCFGTPDFWTADRQRGTIEIIDYKFGHRFVDEFWNPQGLCYAAGILDFLSREWGIGPGILDQNLTLSFTVVQPRCFYKGESVRTHTYKLAEARAAINHLAAMAQAAMLPEPIATTNEHCGDCPGRHSCSALQMAAYSDAEYATARTPLELSPQAAGLELKLLARALERLEARVEGLKELTINNLRAGVAVPYFRLDQGYGRNRWKLPDEQVITIGKMFNVDLSKPGVITPNQAKAAGLLEAVVDANCERPPTALKLTPVNPSDVLKVFS